MSRIFIFITDKPETILSIRKNGCKESSFYFASDYKDFMHFIEKTLPDAVFFESSSSLSPEKIKNFQKIKEHSARNKIFFQEFSDFSSLLPLIQKSPEQNFCDDFESENSKSPAFNMILGTSPEMRKLKHDIVKLASCDFNILITGETGTGKSVIAKAIHELSDRHRKEFVPVNITSIADTLFESSFFGYKKDSFTGALKDTEGYLQKASGSTIFLDEIGDLKKIHQPKLLSVLQERRFSPVGSTENLMTDARFISATNKNIEELIARQKFREDLYSRLKTLEIHVPPLRKHPEDIPLLAQTIMKRLKSPKKLSPAAMEVLQCTVWKDNVRGLESSLTKAVVLSDGSTIEASDLMF